MIMFSWGLEIWYMVYVWYEWGCNVESVQLYNIHLVIRFSILKNKNTTTQRYGDYLNCFGLSDLYVRSKFLSYDILHDFCFEIFYLFLLYGVKCMKECVWLLLFFGNFFFILVFISLNFKWQNEWKNTWETWRWMQIVTFFFKQKKNIFLRIRNAKKR